MRRYLIVDTQACEVRWRFPVEADSEEEALRKYSEGDHGEAVGGAEIGDAIEAFQYDLQIEEEMPHA